METIDPKLPTKCWLCCKDVPAQKLYLKTVYVRYTGKKALACASCRYEIRRRAPKCDEDVQQADDELEDALAADLEDALLGGDLSPRTVCALAAVVTASKK